MTNNPLKVSLVTVVMNGVTSIEKCICSVLEQSYPNIEYIVIDGGSTDGTLSVIEKYKHRIAVIVSEPDKGIADAFNKGLKRATGEITGLVNADDWLEPDAVRTVVNEIGDHDIIYGNMRQCNSDGRHYILTAYHSTLLKGMTLLHPAVFIRKSVYEKTGYYNTAYKLAMDYELLLRCLLTGVTFKHTNSVLTNMKTEGASDLNWLAALKEVKRAKDEHRGKRFSNKTTYLEAAARTAISRALLRSRLEPLFNLYRRINKKVIR